MFLNAINDVYVILKTTETFSNGRAIYRQVRQPAYGASFLLCCEFLDKHGRDVVHPCIFDLDLDYFSEIKIDEWLDAPTQDSAFFESDAPFIQWLFSRMCGMTVALEPKYCGGVHNCLRILNEVSSCLFDPPLLAARSKWKHLNYH